MIASRSAPPSVRREALLVLVRSLDEPSLVKAVARLNREALEILHSLCTVPECDCPVTFLPCPCGDEDCDCPGRQMVAPCACVDLMPEVTLPDRAFAAMAWRLGAYRDPPAPEKASMVTSRDAMAAVMAVRAARGEALRHPDDLLRKRVPDKIARGVSRRRNGTDVTGDLWRDGA